MPNGKSTEACHWNGRREHDGQSRRLRYGVQRVLWSDYKRHNTKQPEFVLDMLETILAAFPIARLATGRSSSPDRGRPRSARPRAASSSRK